MTQPSVPARRWQPPPRAGTLLGAVFVDALGSGLYMSVSVIFFTRYLHLSAGRIGVGLSVAGVASFLCLVPIGVLADRVGPRRMLIGAHLVRAAMLTLYPLASSLPVFIVIVSALGVADRGATPLVQGLFATAVGEEERVRAMGWGRSLQNAGLALGGLGAGAAVLSDGRATYLGIVYGDCLSFLLAAALIVRLGRAAGGRPREGGRPLPWKERLSVFRDRRFSGLTTLNSLVSLHVTVLTTGIPLWVLAEGRIPRAAIAWTVVFNTVLVVLFQVRATRDTRHAADGGRALRRSGLMLAICCGGLALTGTVPVWAGMVLLFAAAGFQAFAEMFQQAGAWAISYDLAPDDRRGAYLAFFGLGHAARNAYGPLVITFLVVRQGTTGWLLLGAVVFVAGTWAARFSRGGAAAGGESAVVETVVEAGSEVGSEVGSAAAGGGAHTEADSAPGSTSGGEARIEAPTAAPTEAGTEARTDGGSRVTQHP
jgi:MFS family permease